MDKKKLMPIKRVLLSVMFITVLMFGATISGQASQISTKDNITKTDSDSQIQVIPEIQMDDSVVGVTDHDAQLWDKYGNIIPGHILSGSTLWLTHGIILNYNKSEATYQVSDTSYLPYSNVASLKPSDGNNTNKITINFQDENNKPIHKSFEFLIPVGTTYDLSSSILSIDGYKFLKTSGPVSGVVSDGDASNITYQYKKNDTPSVTPPVEENDGSVIVNYVDENGKKIANTETMYGKVGDSYSVEKKVISGYSLKTIQGNSAGKFTDKPQTITFVYKKIEQSVAKKGTVVYATKKIGLYGNKNFTKQARKQWYSKKSRINRPMFVVTDYARSKNGHLRYQVKDVNHNSKTDGMKGYITANIDYTVPVYYAGLHKKITVINTQGINSYKNKNLTGKVTHYKRGQTLHVKKIIKHNLTTRFVLANGQYVTANKKLVIADK